MIYIIGSGGVGSWLCPSLCLLTRPGNVSVVDGDTLELKNLNRQLFTTDQIGQNKANALADLYGCAAFPEWYNFNSIAHTAEDWLIVAVDNDPARLAALQACDFYGCKAIFAANEVTSAEAFIYFPEWIETAIDPRIFYPGILTNKADDPQRRAIGCTGEAQVSKPQLVSANYMAAALAQHLFVLWALEFPQMDGDVAALMPHLPYKLVANLSRLETFKIGNLNQKPVVTNGQA